MAKQSLANMTPNVLLTRQRTGGTERLSGAKSAATKEINRRTAEFTTQAEKHQANNPERYQGVHDPGFFNSGVVSRSGGSADEAVTKMRTKSIYRAMNYGSNSEATTTQDHATLPGVAEHVNAMYKMPVRSVLSPQQNTHLEKQAAMFGVTRESARAAAGAHIDQAMRRDPNHQSFYTTEGQDSAGVDHPRERILKSAAEAGVPPHVHAMANAMTSPQTKFAELKHNPATGKKDVVQYTNDDNAKKASIAGKSGDATAIATVKNDPGHFGSHKNTQRAAANVDAVVNGGKNISEVWSSPSPKTGPFHNSWADPNGPDQRWVADTHSGAPLVAPHLKGDEQKLGFMGIKGSGATIHQWIHERASEAMAERGLSSVSGTQSAHWNVQREQSAEGGNRSLINQQHIHKGSRSRHFAAGADPHQGTLF